MSRYKRSEGSLAINGASKQVIMVPSGLAKDANEFPMSNSLGSNHCAVSLVGNPALNAIAIEVMIIPNNAKG